MKRTPLLLAAATPFFAVAAPGELDHDALRDDLKVTDILGAEVRAADDRELGAVEDIILGDGGRIVSVLVQSEGGLATLGGEIEQAAGEAERAVEEGMADVETAGGDEPARADEVDRIAAEGSETGSGMEQGLDPDRADTAEPGDAFVSVGWDAVVFDADNETIRLDGSASQQAVAYDQTGELEMRGEVRASKLVGMEVHLADEDSFGEVEDVLIDPREGRASALVIDSMEFFDKERYAVPLNLDAIDVEAEELTLQYTAQQLEEMGEFEMDAAAREQDSGL